MLRTGKILALVMVLTAAATVCALAGQSAAPDSAASGEIKIPLDKVPKAVFPEVKFTFDPVFEGADIKHDFIVENHGDAPLVIHSIRPD